MSASEAEEQASRPQSVEEKLGESMVALTQLGLTDPASSGDQQSQAQSPIQQSPTVLQASAVLYICTSRLRLDRCYQVLGIGRQLRLAKNQMLNRQLRLACC